VGSPDEALLLAAVAQHSARRIENPSRARRPADRSGPTGADQSAPRSN